MERLVCRGSRVHGIILGKARVPPQLTAFRRRPVGRAVYFGALNSITRLRGARDQFFVAIRIQDRHLKLPTGGASGNFNPAVGLEDLRDL
jgi:hypothetical protein